MIWHTSKARVRGRKIYSVIYPTVDPDTRACIMHDISALIKESATWKLAKKLWCKVITDWDINVMARTDRFIKSCTAAMQDYHTVKCLHLHGLLDMSGISSSARPDLDNNLESSLWSLLKCSSSPASWKSLTGDRNHDTYLNASAQADFLASCCTIWIVRCQSNLQHTKTHLGAPKHCLKHFPLFYQGHLHGNQHVSTSPLSV